MATTHQNAVSAFISYAHEDELLLRHLEKHLSGLKRQGLISTWYDREIIPGTSWAQEIDAHLEQASVILLLVSAHFLASDYCYQVEMTRALERHEAGEARVIPIILRPSDWQHAPFAQLQALPTDAKAVTTWINQDEAFVDIAAGIRRTIEDLSLLPASVSRAKLPATWNIPYPRNPFFIGRDELLAQLHTHLHAGQTTALSQSPHALSGLGGIGKTQVATEYAYRFYQEYEAVLWVRAEGEETLNTSYTEIARLLTLPESDEEQEIVIQAVKAWLQTHRHWLLILDNADDLDLLPPFLPPTPGGHILLTTRAWAMRGLAARLEVKTLANEQGALLLLRRAGRLDPDKDLAQASPDERQWAARLVRELGGLPLALDQAGAYLEATGTSLEEYYHIYEHHRPTLLSKRGSLTPDHPDAVVKTLSLSFQRVEKKHAIAAELLRCCAYLAPDIIPEEIFVQGAKHLGPQLAPVAADFFLLAQAIESLRASSLMGRDPHTQTLTIHRLVQAVLRDSMPTKTQQQWQARVVEALNAAFPERKKIRSELAACERLLQHILVCAAWIERQQKPTQAIASVLARAGEYLRERGRYGEADPLLRRALVAREHLFGPSHPETAASLDNLASLCWQQDKHEEAEQLYLRALSINEQQLGPSSLETASSLNNLANLYWRQSKYEKAEQLYLRALSINEQQLGLDHPDSARSLNNLANLYVHQGKYEQAEPLYQRSLASRTRQLGPDHPDTAQSLNNLAGLYQIQGKYAQAEPLHQQALSIWEKHHGSDHPDVAMSLSNLAELYYDQGKYEQAEASFARALTIRERVLGPNHSDLADTLYRFAILQQSQGHHDEAYSLYKRALMTQIRTLGAGHPDTIATREHLITLLRDIGRTEEATTLEET